MRQGDATKVHSKINNLESQKLLLETTKPVLNFGGHNAELWCEGGELGFVTQMI
jgi:23S rRNA (adenine1618-N6)-methyltransferase